MSVYMFPGQGSQMRGMGAHLFDYFPEVLEQAEKILGYSIPPICLDNPDNMLAQTQYTQPILYVVEVLEYLKKTIEGNKPDYCIGHGVGEYTALFAAGVFDFTTGLRLVQKRGMVMSKHQEGTMLTVINLDVKRIKELLAENNLTNIDIANYNSPKQIVLSGLINDIKSAAQVLSPEALMCIPWKISGAFNSRHMKEASIEFECFLNDIELRNCQIPVLANVNAKPYTFQTIKQTLVQQIISPVQWTAIIQNLKTLGEEDFIEVGPGNMLSRLMTQMP